ncbi:MAG: putative acetyltransferase [Rhodobacteraceae bacterium HLUCCA08]|nr:MAG: putative acetyltransferase [Rhodobacteraceae bacterium HLUCCA08]
MLQDGDHPIAPGKLAAVVTHLEMTAPPMQAAVPDLPVRLDEVARIDPARYLALFRAVGSGWLWAARLRLTPEALAARLHAPTTRLFLPQGPKGDLGILELDFATQGACAIAYFGLVPEAVGQGIGRWLMFHAIQTAFATPGVTRLWLHTCTLDSPAALPFYRAMGFVPFRRSVEVFDDPRVTGALPRDAAPQVPLL